MNLQSPFDAISLLVSGGALPLAASSSPPIPLPMAAALPRDGTFLPGEPALAGFPAILRFFGLNSSYV